MPGEVARAASLLLDARAKLRWQPGRNGPHQRDHLALALERTQQIGALGQPALGLPSPPAPKRPVRECGHKLFKVGDPIV